MKNNKACTLAIHPRYSDNYSSSSPDYTRILGQSQGLRSLRAHAHWVAPGIKIFVYIFTFWDSFWLNSSKLNASMMRLHCMQFNSSISLGGVFWNENIPKTTLYYIWYEILTAVVKKSSVFWDVKPCSMITATVACCLLPAGYLRGLPFNPDVGWTKFPLKLPLTFNGLHGITSQNSELFTLYYVCAVNTSLQHWINAQQ
jgi:hypothetical protein